MIAPEERVAGPKQPRIFLLIPTFLPNDAVGNDVLGMYRILRDAGRDVRVLAEHIHSEYAPIAALARPDARDLWDDPAAILIYHHALEWKTGEEILQRTRNRIVIKYHNITPPEFYTRYNAEYCGWCIRGQEATRRLARSRADFIWGDSVYNSREFMGMGAPAESCRVLPPIHRIEELGRVPLDAAVTGAYRGDTLNILFVGALRPHKGHFKALDVLAAYRRLSRRRARMIFAGSFDPHLEQYVREVEEYARRLNVESSLTFHRSTTMSELRAYYTTASVFLCVSEHEGFCVPLAEAMYFRSPIVAWATTAVGETCDNCGLVYGDFKAETLAEGIAEYAENPALGRSMAGRGRERYETAFHPDAIRQRLLALLGEVDAMGC
jgi:glycosyltransferase involved in cell wall biosynthesis